MRPGLLSLKKRKPKAYTMGYKDAVPPVKLRAGSSGLKKILNFVAGGKIVVSLVVQ
jgi:hypothetical protein